MTFVEEYAHLEHEASIYQAHGKPVPARIQQRAAYIEGFVKSQLHPAQIQAAIQQKDRILANLHRQRIEIDMPVKPRRFE